MYSCIVVGVCEHLVPYNIRGHLSLFYTEGKGVRERKDGRWKKGSEGGEMRVVREGEVKKEKGWDGKREREKGGKKREGMGGEGGEGR